MLQENVASGAASVSDTPFVHTHHFQQALQRVAPSVSKKDQKVYDALRWQLRSSRGHLNPQVPHNCCSQWQAFSLGADGRLLSDLPSLSQAYSGHQQFPVATSAS